MEERLENFRLSDRMYSTIIHGCMLGDHQMYSTNSIRMYARRPQDILCNSTWTYAGGPPDVLHWVNSASIRPYSTGCTILF
jgi:hypothetical protein